MIPKVIHYCWFGGGEKSPLIKKCMESWKNMCPDYEIREWNEHNFDTQRHPFMKKAFEEKKYSFVSDYARLQCIYTYGGIYLDTDVELLKSLDPLLTLHGFIGTEKKGELVNPGSGFGAIKEHLTIQKFLDIYKDMDFENEDGVLRMTPIPCLVTPILTNMGFVPDGTYQTVGDMDILPVDYLCPLDYDGELKITENTYSIHYFSGTWVDDRLKQHSLRQAKLTKIFGSTIAVSLGYLIKIYQRKGIFHVIKRFPFLVQKFVVSHMKR